MNCSNAREKRPMKRWRPTLMPGVIGFQAHTKEA